MKNKFVALAGAIVAMTAAAVPAHASDAQLGVISHVLGMSNGAVLFSTNGSRGPRPACSGAGLDARYAINASTLVGQSQLSAFMTAYTLKKRIFIRGTGTCSIWPDTETVDYFEIED
ncbi:hypothetical protein ASD79_05660 [Caulobacter sp. Root655]|uniref:hypothetical protein n=1 Tax=Caulobacter sp. Root655 TaxID=1736578 RepID=UPI0006FCFA04|nr:hypothetical protein [Caulobacter sp. Root655]KRA61898.1 hypothetical protein ASD79_05660 [Caulobacter sp. Root655]